MRSFLAFALLLASFCARSQTLGGNALYNFLKLPASALLSASGGVNVSYRTNEAGLATNNPALLGRETSGQLSLSFNGLPGGVQAYSLTGAGYSAKKDLALAGQVYFMDYGTVPQTDAAGNVSGTFHPVDFVVQGSASRSYLERWHFGASMKFIRSSYGIYRSSALAFDAGIHYRDSAHGFSAGLLARNMGAQLTTYASEREDLPFDFQIGITQRLKKAPLGFSFTAQHLQRFNLNYNDTTFNNENDFSSNTHFFGKLLNHVVVAAHVYLGANLEATFGYNRLRRSELNIGATGNGLTGFSFGLRGSFQKLQVLYARSSYQRNVAYNQLGLVLQLDQLFGLGKSL